MSSGRSLAYVAAGQIPPAAPPPNSTGAIGWVRANLFPGPVNSLMTIISIAVVLLLLPPIIDWAFLKGVWNATSLQNCREIIVATHGEGAKGACWAVINERFNQFLFGFYPSELYWRPSLAFFLLLAALAPVLFSDLPFRRALLVHAALFPLIAVFLIWGGSIWGKLLVLAGPMIGRPSPGRAG